MRLICNSCGRDLNEIYQDNMSCTIGSVLCEDCAGYPQEVTDTTFWRDYPARVLEVGKNPDGTIRCACPDCGHMFHEKSHITNYCPSCGCDMRGERDGEK